MEKAVFGEIETGNILCCHNNNCEDRMKYRDRDVNVFQEYFFEDELCVLQALEVPACFNRQQMFKSLNSYT